MKNNVFSFKEFGNPDAKYYPVYAWIWNDVLDKKEICRQIDEMYEQNIFSVYVTPLSSEFRPDTLVTNLQPPYLSDGYLDMFKTAVDYAAEKGIKFWLYDESGWPSGSANFEVMKNDESLALTVILDGDIVTHNRLSDLTNPDATKKFIELTHCKYKEKMGESFKKLAPYIFTDEPSICSAPFTETLKKEFLERTGVELDFEKVKNHDDVQYNLLYHDVCSAVFADNYFKLVKKWCNDNGMMLTGHINGDDNTLGYAISGHHYAMRLLRTMDVPGVDVILGQIEPDKECLFFPRLASSAAMQTGCGLSLSESLSVYGSIPFERIQYCLGYQLVRGINMLNMMLKTYDSTGYYSVRFRPEFSGIFPGGDYIGQYNNYIASLQYIMRGGIPAVDCALYMPVRDFWADDLHTEVAAKAYDELGVAIERNHCQFDIIDDDFIMDCDDTLDQGIMKMGRAAYTTIYIPSDVYMPDEVREKLKIFEAGGGKIYYPNNAVYNPIMDISGDNGNLRVHKRKYDNCDIYVVFNESSKSVTAKIKMPENTCEINAFDKKAYEFCENYTFESGEIKVFATGIDPEVGLLKNITPDKVVCEISEFEMKPVKRFTVDIESTKSTDIDGLAVTTGCGEWNQIVGDDFSGECEYRTHFEIDSVEDAVVLDLGTVKYSCRVFVNGHDLGICAMPPYRYVIDKTILQKNNELVIKVSNTSANAFVSFEIPEEWEEKHFGSYHKMCVDQEKRFISSGLVGPVKIMNIVKK